MLISKTKRKLIYILLSFIFIELLTVSFYAYRTHTKKIQHEDFTKFYLGKLLFPKLAMTRMESEFQIPIFAGDREAEFSWFRMVSPDSLLGWRMKKNMRALHYGIYPYITNSQGFTSTGTTDFYYPKEKPKGKFRVIMIGGSTVFGQGALVPSENLPAQLHDALLKYYPSDQIEVINAGITGHSSSQELVYLMSELVFYQPDLVVACDGWNDYDYTNLAIQDLKENWVPMRTLTHDANALNLESITTVPGAFRRLVSISTKTLLFGMYAVTEGFASLHLAGRIWIYLGLNRWLDMEKIATLFHEAPIANRNITKGFYDPRSVQEYRNNLETMIFVAKLRGFKIALFLQPVMGKISGPKKILSDVEKIHWDRGVNDPRKDFEVRSAFYSDAIPMFKTLQKKYEPKKEACIENLTRAFENTPETVYADNGHLAYLGNKILAEAIVENLRRCGFIKKAVAH